MRKISDLICPECNSWNVFIEKMDKNTLLGFCKECHLNYLVDSKV